MSAVLRVDAAGKRYGALDAIVDIGFEVGRGELVAVVGPNGAGKTTLLSIVAGIQAPSSGGVTLTDTAAGVGWAPQHPALYSRLSVAENLELFARLERVADPHAAVARMLEQTGLRERAREPVVRLSGGNRQRVNVAIGLLADPALLALDEPSASLDPGQRERLWDFLTARAAAGTAVLFSTHNVSEAQRYAGRVLVLARGRLLFDGPPRELVRAASEGTYDGRDGDLEHALVRYLREHEGAAAPTAAASSPEGEAGQGGA